MLTDQFTRLHLAKVRLTTEERKKDERFPVFAVGLVLEPLTYSQAKQLGAGVLGHCFTDKKSIQESLTNVTVALALNEQRFVVRMAEDVSPHCELKNVRVTHVTITKREASDAGVAALGADFEPLPTGDALLQWWLPRLPHGERVILGVLVSAGGKPIAREAIDEATPFKRSSRDAYLSRLAARKLVTSVGRGEVQASAELFG